MSTAWTVFRLEWRILRRDRAAQAILMVFAVFLVLAALAGGRHAAAVDEGVSRALEAQHARLSALEQASGAGRDASDPMWVGREGGARLAVLPAAPLASLAVGQRDTAAQAVLVTTALHADAVRDTETAMATPMRQTTGAFDPAFLFVVLFPLVIIALSYDLLSGERERGTLALLLSQPVSQSALVMGKAGARAVALCAVTLVFAGVGLFIAGASLDTAAAWAQVGLYGALLVSWALFWFAAAVVAGAWVKNSVQSALVLVGLWLVLVVVVPGLVYVAIDTLYPPPSRLALVHEAREAARDVERTLVGLEGRHDQDVTSGDFTRKVIEAEEAVAARTDEVHEVHEAQLERRQEVVSALRFVSPALVVQLALEDIAGSGAARHERFEAQVDVYRDTYRAYFVEKIRAGARLTAADRAAVPNFVFEEEATSALLGRVLAGVFTLLILGAALLAAARPGLRKVGRLAR